MAIVSEGAKAPRFEGRTSTSGSLSLDDFLGDRHVVLFFYVKDFTPGWTIEARDFRARYPEFTALGAEVVGVSNDAQGRHAAFAESLDLPYPLLSDPKGAIAKAYGVNRAGFLPNRRTTVVIDRGGVVRKVVKAELDMSHHAREALSALQELG